MKVGRMMRAVLVAGALALALCSCTAMDTGQSADAVGGVTHEAQDYVLEVEYTSDYRILQLTDIHLGMKDAQDKHFAFLDLTIRDSDCDFIMVTGDLFTYADKATARRLFDFLDSYGVPWSVTFGNHDEQCYFSIDWLTDYLNNYGSNCVFCDLQDDDVFGNANFVINLMRGNEVFDQLIVLDSNRYYYGSYFGYDYIKPSQIAWYERMVTYSAEQNGGEVVPSLLFYHIPVPETADAWEAHLNGDENCIYLTGELNEGVFAPEYNSGFFAKVLELGSSRAMFFGHDHVNDFIVQYQGIYFAYGIHSTDRIYGSTDMMGGRVVTIHDDHSLSFTDVFHTYDEVR